MTIVKLNKNNIALNSNGDQIYDFDNDQVASFQFRLADGSLLEIPIERCTRIAGGYYKSEYDGEEYIFDDGNRYESVLLGYLVYEDYDTKNITDKETGVQIRNDLFDLISTHYGLYSGAKEVEKNGDKYIVCVDKINNIVNKNQQRKEEGKKVFPFIKTMDKFGTFYLSIFSKSRDEIKTKVDSAAIVDDILSTISSTGRFKFVSKDHFRIPLYM